MSTLEVSSAKLLASQVPLGTSWNRVDFRLTVVSRPKYTGHIFEESISFWPTGLTTVDTCCSQHSGRTQMCKEHSHCEKISVDSLWVAFSESTKHCVDMLNEFFIKAFAFIHQCLVYTFCPSRDSYCKDPCPKDNTYTYIRIHNIYQTKFVIHLGTWCNARSNSVQTRPIMDSLFF